MTRLRAIITLLLCVMAFPGVLLAQKQMEWEFQALNEKGWVEYSYETGLGLGTNGVLVKYGSAVLTADQVSLNYDTGEVVADGGVRIQNDDQVWVGEHIRYNFKTHQMQAEQFRTGRTPVYASGYALHGDRTNNIYSATNAYVTTDDIKNPAFKVRAKYIKIIPGDKIVAKNAILYAEGVPIFYFPYYSRNIGQHANNFNFVPGYRSSWGPFLMSSYDFYMNQYLDGNVHVDYREKRGFGEGPNLNYHLGKWGDGYLRYYYMYDTNPDESGDPNTPNNRQRVDFSYQAMPATNFTVKSMIRYQSDTNIVREFFEGEYFENPQPSTYFDFDKFWQNWNADAYIQPRLNNFLDTIERLPEVRLNGDRQQVLGSPLFYESQSSAGYYEHLFAETNNVPSGPEYEAMRVDSYHQLLLPETAFGWLNMTPHVGGRYTYYGDATGPGATTGEVNRWVFDSGVDVSAQASRVWPDAQNKTFEIDGIRHIIEPSIGYMYASPTAWGTNVIPQFDYQLPSIRLLPITFPDYNSIDSIQPENVLRFGLHNKLQTKRDGVVTNFMDWNVYTDWNLRPITNQTTFADLYSDFTVRPKSWLTLESLTRYELGEGLWRMSLTTVTLQPYRTWSWTFGQFYVRPDLSDSPTALGEGNNLFLSTFYYRVSENWGFRMSHRFSAANGSMQEQDYTIYRDMRSWTAALTLRVLNNVNGKQDITVAFTFSLKAAPRFGVGSDSGLPRWLLGG